MSAVPTSTIAASSRMPAVGTLTRWTAAGADAAASRGSSAAGRVAAATGTEHISANTRDPNTLRMTTKPRTLHVLCRVHLSQRTPTGLQALCHGEKARQLVAATVERADGSARIQPLRKNLLTICRRGRRVRC